jgi:hypothetical protein
MKKVKIYVKDKRTQRLVIQKTWIPNTATLNEKVFWVTKELMSGPAGSNYERVFNPDTDVQKVIIKEGVAYISFGWMLTESLQKEPVLAVRAIVNSVLLNIREIEGVKILIEGIEPVSSYSNISLYVTFRKPLEPLKKG